MRWGIGNHRFPIMSNTNLREWENEFSHCCKLVLLSCRIVSLATCLLMTSKHDIDCFFKVLSTFNFVEPAFAHSKNSNKFGFRLLTRSFVLLSNITHQLSRSCTCSLMVSKHDID